MKREGGWWIELRHPLRYNNQVVDVIKIRPMSMDDVIKYSDGRISSNVGLLAYLCGVPERALLEMNYAEDMDRVMSALINMMPVVLRDEYARRPQITPSDQLDHEEAVSGVTAVNDPIDPRFPKVDGPVTRITKVAAPGETRKPVTSSIPPGLGGVGDPSGPVPPGLGGVAQLPESDSGMSVGLVDEVMRKVG
jgi:hypothetical protein